MIRLIHRLVPALTLSLLAACQSSSAGSATHPKPVSSDPTAEDYVPPPLPSGRVVLTDAFGAAHAVEVELAVTHDTRGRGLMWRRELASGKGMLFIFGEEELHSFWMKNTLIPLDMLFINGARQIVGVVRNAEPRTLISRGAEQPSRYVLEVPGGWTEKMAIRTGTTVELSLPPALAVEP